MPEAIGSVSYRLRCWMLSGLERVFQPQTLGTPRSPRLEVGRLDVPLPSLSLHASFLLLGYVYAEVASIPFVVSRRFGRYHALQM